MLKVLLVPTVKIDLDEVNFEGKEENNIKSLFSFFWHNVNGD